MKNNIIHNAVWKLILLYKIQEVLNVAMAASPSELVLIVLSTNVRFQTNFYEESGKQSC